MAEKETVFSSKVKNVGIFSFPDFYKFAYDWLTEETGVEISEDKYEEKLAGDSKNILVEWSGDRKLTDYFKLGIKVKLIINGLTNVETTQAGQKINTNKGSITVEVKGDLVRDYDGKFETSAFNKFLRSIYEKWVIPSRIEEFEGKVAGDCDEFLGQVKAYLALEGKK